MTEETVLDFFFVGLVAESQNFHAGLKLGQLSCFLHKDNARKEWRNSNQNKMHSIDKRFFFFWFCLWIYYLRCKGKTLSLKEGNNVRVKTLTVLTLEKSRRLYFLNSSIDYPEYLTHPSLQIIQSIWAQSDQQVMCVGV